jgi:hypothetical protein
VVTPRHVMSTSMLTISHELPVPQVLCVLHKISFNEIQVKQPILHGQEEFLFCDDIRR